MIITKLYGGLGNQMFQYAAGRNLAIKNKVRLMLDISHYDEYPQLNRKFELDHFSLPADIQFGGAPKRCYDPAINHASFLSKQLAKIGAPERVTEKGFSYALIGLVGNETEDVGRFDPAVLNSGRNTYLVGFWNNEKYFIDSEKQIRSDFQFRSKPSGVNAKLLAEMSACNSVSLHIRRGDYVTSKDAINTIGSLDPGYYERAVAHIGQKTKDPHFYVFSDDPKWCAKNLKIKGSKIIDVNPPSKGYEDMRLMSGCKHNIIANSTFSWWGAWLNPNPHKIVVAPKTWFVDKNINTSDVVPSRWIRL